MTRSLNPPEPLPEIMAKIKGIDSLPTFAEVELLFKFFEQKAKEEHSRYMSWNRLCHELNSHTLYNVEMIDALAEAIRQLNPDRVVEVCAGTGKLSYQLGMRDISIIATDGYSARRIIRDPELVVRASHRNALMRYHPSFVIGAWIPDDTAIGWDILDFPTVEYFIDIGERPGGATWMTDEICNRQDYTMAPLEDVDKHSICVTDVEDCTNHSHATLFRKV